jgi:leucyl aminopeptidase
MSLVAQFLSRHVRPPAATAAILLRTVVPGATKKAENVVMTRETAPTLFALESVGAQSAMLSEELQLRLYQFDKRAASGGALVYRGAHQKHFLATTEADIDEAHGLGVALAHCENIAKYWADLPSNWLTPRRFVAAVQELFAAELADGRARLRVLDEHELRAGGFGGIVGVAQGSVEPPRLLVLEIGGVDSDAARILHLVGKGVTFDAGGISIKPAKDMYAMKADMTGAAVVCAAAYAAAALAPRDAVPPLRVVVPLAENLPSHTAIKPGDVLRMYDGRTVEVDNTDAEGRLLLGDAVAFAAREYGARRFVTVATLTGAIDVALGAHYFGAFCTHDATFAAVARHAAASNTPAWRMPFDERYEKQLRSNVADLLNCSRARGGGACTAAWFVRTFAPPDADVAHLDIAGVMQHKDGGMSGVPTRALARLLRDHEFLR